MERKNLWTAALSATVHNHRITRIRHARWNTCEEPGEGTCRRFPKVASLITFRGVGTPERMILEFGSAAFPRCGRRPIDSRVMRLGRAFPGCARPSVVHASCFRNDDVFPNVGMTRSSNAKLRTYVFCSVFRHIPNETYNRLGATQLKIFNYSSCRDAIFGLKNRVKRRAGRPPSCLRRSLAVVALFRFATLVRSCFRSPPFRRGKPYSLSVVVVSGPVFSLDFGCFEAVQVSIGIKKII